MDIILIGGRTTYILLFGVYHPKGEPSYAGLIAVNLQERTWAMIKMGDEGSAVEPVPRLGASMVVVGEEVFIFGGGRTRDGWDVSSFSKAKFDGVGGAWRWDFCDRRFPAHLFGSQLLWSLQVSLISRGREIIFATGTHDEATGVSS
jgi:hypothetical protein